MRKTALAAALALAMGLPGSAMAGGWGASEHSTLHLAGVKLHLHFGGHPKQKFRGKHHRPHARGHKRFIVPHHPHRRHGFAGRPDHRRKHLERGFSGPKVWYYKPGHKSHFKPWRFKRHGHGHLERRALEHRAFKHRPHRRFERRHHRRWRR